MNIRTAELVDVDDICRIYNYYIQHSVATFKETPEDKTHFSAILTENKTNNIPFLVATLNNKIVGYSYLYPYNSERTAYRFTYLDVIYLDPDYLGKGIGSQLLEAVIDKAKSTNIHRVLSLISLTEENNPSVILHKKQGFELVGRMSGVGYKFDQWIDVVIMQLKLC